MKLSSSLPAFVAALALTVLAVQIPDGAVAAPAPALPSGSFSLRGPHLTMPPPLIGRSETAATVIAPAATGGASLKLDLSQQEQYWFWAYGVEVSAANFAPNESVTVSDIGPDRKRVAWPAVTADASGSLTERFRWYDVEPDNNRPALGLHQITVTGASGVSAAATFNVVKNADEKLPVTVSKSRISQDAFLRTPVEITVAGLRPKERVYLNVGLPDRTTVGIGDNEPLRANAAGVLRYPLHAASVNQPTGTWSVYAQGAQGEEYGTAEFTVGAGKQRLENKTLASTPAISLTRFGDKAVGLPFTAARFNSFDAFETRLTTPRGVTLPLGVIRTNGNGTATNQVVGFTSAPAGRYRLEARSMTTGDFAVRFFDVLGDPTTTSPTVTPSTATITQRLLASQGLTLRGTNFAPSTSVNIEIRDGAGNRMALTTGTNLQATTDADGTVMASVRSNGAAKLGRYTATITTGDGSVPTDYVAQTTFTVTAR